MNIRMEASWHEKLAAEFDKPYFRGLTEFVRKEYAVRTCYPPGKLIFSAFDHTPFEQVKVVILGQDPYHGPGQANGLCFSVSPGVPAPPSLKNIFREVQQDTGMKDPSNADLSRWADQGVLLLNATLTVRDGQAGSHQNKGWEQFTDAAIAALNSGREHLVFMLWGNYAQRKGAHIDPNRHLVLRSVHPSPLSAHQGFFGNHHFSRANVYLKEHGQTPIEW